VLFSHGCIQGLGFVSHKLKRFVHPKHEGNEELRNGQNQSKSKIPGSMDCFHCGEGFVMN
jgi:hypothetical protein